MLEKVKSGILGLIVGDALGVPVEFKYRTELDKNPITDMIGFGTHNQPPGTWSDDSSMTLCTMDSLCKGFNLLDIAEKFKDWYDKGLWTPRGHVFDIGITTRKSIELLKQGESPEVTGGFDEYSNGNGSLMRILPLAYYLYKEDDIDKRYTIIKEVSTITHAHFRAVFACFIYVEYARLLITGFDKFEVLDKIKMLMIEYAYNQGFNPEEITLFSKVLKSNIQGFKREDIKSSGYVLDTLEASLWCFLTSNSYEETVLKAANLGDDTDTIAAIAGGLAGLYYGNDQIPEKWKSQLLRNEDIEQLIERFSKSLEHKK
ncbi:ADP-ribosylglycohydrolase family protein [Aquimarina rhabdastrellae]